MHVIKKTLKYLQLYHNHQIQVASCSRLIWQAKTTTNTKIQKN